MNKLVVTAVAVFVIISACTRGSNADLDGYLQNLIDNHHYVGFVALVDQVDKPLWVKAYGKSNIKANRKTHINDLYRIASSTKPFIAALVVKLAIANKIKLDDKLSHYLSAKTLQGIRNANTATIRQLLAMQSGIYNYTDNPKYSHYLQKYPRHFWVAENALNFARNMPASFAPGTASKYSNTNYILLGLVIEKVSGHSLARELQTKIFIPLGLHQTYLEKQQTLPSTIVPGYAFTQGQFDNVSRIDDGRELADGGIISTAKDLNHFLRSLLSDNNFMPPQWRQQMLSCHPMQSSDHIEYGLGLVCYKVKTGILIGHDGDNPGYQSLMFYQLKTHKSFVLLNNNNPPRLDQNKLWARVFKP